ncbi:hypothetical protein KQ778_16435, partial [Listeria monocytogenes]|nr:hypothetical protein [Listeria monocytogenes]
MAAREKAAEICFYVVFSALSRRPEELIVRALEIVADETVQPQPASMCPRSSRFRCQASASRN